MFLVPFIGMHKERAAESLVFKSGRIGASGYKARYIVTDKVFVSDFRSVLNYFNIGFCHIIKLKEHKVILSE